MDCAKTGKLILQLRKEKGMTQRQLADKLCISNKTVSKWECGLGCPDITLWNGLSEALGADILKILQGELKPNRVDVGKIDKVRFYVCPVCGNILMSTGDASISCCGRKLHPLKADLCSKGHEINVIETDMDLFITIKHDMEKDHYISFSAYVHDDRALINRLYPEQPAEIRLPVMKRGGYLYLYCIRHGLIKYPINL